MNLIAMQIGGFNPIAFGSLFWMVIAILVAIICGILALVHEFVILPPIARKLRGAKWSKGHPAFIQDDMGVVHFYMSDKYLPEGLLYSKKTGWALLPRLPHTSEELTDEEVKLIDAEDDPKKKRKLYNTFMKEKKYTPEQENAIQIVLQTPILEGLNKSVFFGHYGQALLTNLKTIAHAHLPVMNEIINASMNKSGLSQIASYAENKGYLKRGGETNTIVILAISVIAVVATVGLVFYFLTSGGA
jgi:hypothetical protein